MSDAVASEGLELVSWNLNGLDERLAAPRAEAALQEVLLGARIEQLADGAPPRDPPDVLLLQEVTRAVHHAVLKPHLGAAGFTLCPDSPPDRSYFEVLAVRPPSQLEGFASEPLWKTQYGRWQHELRLSKSGRPWRILSAHLDSGPEASTAAARRAQLADIAQQLGEGPRAVFAGDTNLRDAEWAAVAPPITDAWEAGGRPAAHRFTWTQGKRRARFDRAWLSADLRVESFETIGAAPLPGGPPPSDHLGLRVRLRSGAEPEGA